MTSRIRLLLGVIATMSWGCSRARLTLEQKLEILARCGLRLAPPFTVEDLLTSYNRTVYEKPGFDAVLVGLCTTEEKPLWRNRCINGWHFDAEAIEDHGDYAKIAERLKAMAQGSLPIEHIRDHVDIESRQAWLAFQFNGKEIRIDCRVDDDWVDAAVFSHFVRMLANSDQSKIFLYYDLRGQDCILACVTKAQFADLKAAGIDFQALT